MSGLRRAVLLAAVGGTLVPLVLSLSLGWWNPLAALELSGLHFALARMTRPLLDTPFAEHPLLALALAAALGGLHSLVSRRGLSGLRFIEWPLCILAGLVGLWAALLLLALDPLLCLLLALVLGLPPAYWPTSASPIPTRQPSSTLPSLGLAASCAAILLSASLASLGSQHDSPLRALDWLWVEALGRSPALHALFWGAVAAAAVWLRFRHRLLEAVRGAPDRRSWVGPGLSATLLVLGTAARGLSAGSGIWLLSAAALLLWCPPLLRLARQRRPRRPPLAALGLGGALLALSILRTTAILQWTPATLLPPRVQVLSDSAGFFALAWDEAKGQLLTTRRAENLIELWDLGEAGANRVQQWQPQSGSSWTPEDSVEAVYGPAGGQFWVAVVQADGGHGLLAIHPMDGPGAFVQLGNCNPTSWLLLPDAALVAVGGAAGEVLVGCESSGAAVRFAPSTGRVVGTVPVPRGLEDAAFSEDGSRLFGLQLWGHPWLAAFAWPTGEVRARRRVGPLSWGLERERLPAPSPGETGGSRLWLARFLEGVVLGIDPKDLSIKTMIRLSPGLRDLQVDAKQGLLWAAASLSGTVWEVATDGSSAPRAHPVCGAPRHLVLDAMGRALVASDCGIFRITPGVTR